MKYYWPILCLWFFCLSARGLVLPTEFRVRERAVSSISAFDLESTDEDDPQQLGEVSEPFFALTPTFHMTDPEGIIVATAKRTFPSQIDVFDKDRLLGTVRQEQIKTLPPATVYTIVDNEGQCVALSDALDSTTSLFRIWSCDNEDDQTLLATIEQPLFDLIDNWLIRVQEPEQVDTRFLVMIAAFQSRDGEDADTVDVTFLDDEEEE